MGLDMYLYARRPVTGDAMTPVLDVLDRHDLKAESYAGEPPLTYVQCWDYGQERTLRPEARELLDATGMAGLFNHANGIGLHVRHFEDRLEVEVECAYWRKANAIHDWFVRECQGGIDECQYSDAIHPEKLAQLRTHCLEAIEYYDHGDTDSATSLLTPTSGFFFGSTEAGEWYRRDLADTVDQLERVFTAAAELADPTLTFHYHSSW